MIELVAVIAVCLFLLVAWQEIREARHRPAMPVAPVWEAECAVPGCHRAVSHTGRHDD